MSSIKSLDEIGIKYGTDKSSLGHHYLSAYEFFLNPLKDQNIVLLEIGVYKGASLKMWEEYFPKAQLIGVDTDPDIKNLENERISVEIGDICSKNVLDRLKKYPKIDIIIDDASHQWDHQRIAFEELFQLVSPGGYYIVEDLHTSYLPEFSGQDSLSFMEYLKNRLDYNNLTINYNQLIQETRLNHENAIKAEIRTIEKQIHFMTFISRACIIKKRS